jgi:transcriptional regulator with XRE-family HTH domain
MRNADAVNHVSAIICEKRGKSLTMQPFEGSIAGMRRSKMDIVNARIRERIRSLLRERGLSQADVARSARNAFSVDRFSKWLREPEEGGKGLIPLADAWLIARALDVPLEALVEPHPSPLPPIRSEVERLFLSLCRELGVEEASRRLVAATDGHGKADGAMTSTKVGFIKTLDVQGREPKSGSRKRRPRKKQD